MSFIAALLMLGLLQEYTTFVRARQTLTVEEIKLRTGTSLLLTYSLCLARCSCSSSCCW